MIRLTRLNRVPLVVNCDLIEHIETTPDTVIAHSVALRAEEVVAAPEAAVVAPVATPSFCGTNINTQGSSYKEN